MFTHEGTTDTVDFQINMTHKQTLSQSMEELLQKLQIVIEVIVTEMNCNLKRNPL